jgi:predicted amidophosphoribosyltransferase
MYCHFCGKELHDNFHFCTNCGKPKDVKGNETCSDIKKNDGKRPLSFDEFLKVRSVKEHERGEGGIMKKFKVC